MLKQIHPYRSLAWLFLLAIAVLGLGYFTPRQEFWQVLAWFVAAFIAYSQLSKSEMPFRQGLLAAVVIRLLLLFALPALSDDYFRFIWDGKLLAHGLNPLQQVPSEWLNQQQLWPQLGFTTELYEGLNSKHYFTVYPPVCQFIFWLSAKISPEGLLGPVIVMRLFIIAAEAGTIWLLSRLMLKLGLPEKNIYLYAFNPLVIVELTGNLHFEALMIFFWLLSVFWLFSSGIAQSSAVLALGVAVKLLPLLTLPFLIRRLGWKQFVIFCSCFGILLVLLLFPMLSSEAFIGNFWQSLDLYFQKFEFNASVYYVLREIGFWWSGYNEIAFLGPLLSILAVIALLLLAAFEKHTSISSLFGTLLAALTIYFFLATTVHPWYLTTLVAFATCTRYRYPMVWSFLAVLSYATYSTPAYEENYWLVFLEYLVVLVVIFTELKIHRLRQPLQNLLRKRKKKKQY